jgi:hypothetical protein
MSERLLATDVSHWDSDPKTHETMINFKDLAEQGGVKIVIAKGDKAALSHIIGGRDAGMYTAIYHWHDPSKSVQQNLDEIEHWNNTLNPDFFCEDVEQWWADWNKWWMAINGQIPWSSVPRVAPDKLNGHAYQTYYGGKEITKKYTMLYSALWFIRAYCPKMEQWAVQEPLWLADYSAFGATKRRPTWEQFREYVNCTNGATYKPKGLDREVMHQFTDAVIPPGHKSPIDLSVMFKSEDELKKLIGREIAEPPKPEPEPEPSEEIVLYSGEVKAYALTIRSTPNVPLLNNNKLGYLRTGDPVNVYEISNGWARIHKEQQRWVSAKWIEKTSDVYVEAPEVLYQAKVNTWALNIRPTPSTEGKPVGGVYYNNPVTVYELVNGWARVHASEQQWVLEKYLRKV